ncbi:MAG: hypothetical protein LBK99_14200 [Opitutaceae bacterium]|jgi:Flp pilus assembly protein TadD|nr:hypothetical protein [Opitutaceae bacterium]
MNDIHKEFLLTLAYVYMQNAKQEQALVLLRVLKSLWPEDLRVARCFAFGCLLAGDAATALAECDAAFGSSPRGPDREPAFLLKSRSLWRLGREDEARQALREAFRT